MPDYTEQERRNMATVDELFEIEGGIAAHPRVAARPEIVNAFTASTLITCNKPLTTSIMPRVC